jgi:hypothetical protein
MSTVKSQRVTGKKTTIKKYQGVDKKAKSKTEDGIYYSDNYDQFKFFNWNRAIDLDHVEHLKESYKQGQYKNPILVIPIEGSKEEYGILDGQHRYVVLKELKRPIEYMIEQNEINTQNAIISLNTTGSRWNIFDYVEAYARSGNKNYQNILDLKTEFPQFKNNTNYLMLVDGHRSSHTKRKNHIIDGSFQILNFDKIITRTKIILDFAGIRFFPNSKLLGAIMNVIELPGYDHKRMVKKIDLYPTLIHRCVTTNEYQEMLINLYNYNQSSTTKIKSNTF